MKKPIITEKAEENLSAESSRGMLIGKTKQI
jgi:hypothetical protein